MRIFQPIVLLALLLGCTSIPEIDTQQLKPSEVIGVMGPPARITFDNTVFNKGWIKGTTEYRYYSITPSGNVGEWAVFYKQQEWMGASYSFGFFDRGNRLLDIRRPKDRQYIEEYEAKKPGLQKNNTAEQGA